MYFFYQHFSRRGYVQQFIINLMFAWHVDAKNFKLMIDGQQYTRNDLLRMMQQYFSHKLEREIPSSYLNQYSFFPPQHELRKYYSQILLKKEKLNIQALKLTKDELRAVGCMVGCAVGDALGASTQFQSFKKERIPWIPNGFADLEQCIKNGTLSERHGEMGIWTDDCSMANSMGYSLLINQFQFKPIHIRYMFHLWLHHGLGNGGRSISIGLGGNISISTRQFSYDQTPYTSVNKRFNSGNGSLMRLAPVPICFRKNEKQAMEMSGLSSRTTHDGDEAEECCRLFAKILVRLMNRPADSEWREVLLEALNEFESQVESVVFLARSEQETDEQYKKAVEKYGSSFGSNNPSLQDRNWNWKNEEWSYSRFRAKRQPSYIGSYCMDALAMALHIVWHRESFKQAVLWAINMGGDCDTVGAIVGQLAGAIYGYDQDMHELYQGMQDIQKERMEVFLIGVMLARRSDKVPE